MAEVLAWAEANPGRFTYPAPPDFTGSVFVRQVLYSVSGGYDAVPATYDDATFDRLTPALWERLTELAPSLWRGGRTYPRDSVALDKLFADGQVDMTMTYGPATLTELVAEGTFPKTTRVLSLDEGNGRQRQLPRHPRNIGQHRGRHGRGQPRPVARAAAASRPTRRSGGSSPCWTSRACPTLTSGPSRRCPASDVVPPYPVLSRNANPELSSAWVPALDEGWRRDVLAAVQ